MFKNFKKHSKLLLLALIFSASSAFSMFAAEPHQNPNDDALKRTYQVQKRKRDDSEELQNLKKRYDVTGLIDIQFELKGANKVSCEVIKKYNPCNRNLSRFYLIPERNSGILRRIGTKCLQKLLDQSGTSKIRKISAVTLRDSEKEGRSAEAYDICDIPAHILAYFFDQRNWNNRCPHKNINGKNVALANSGKNFVLDLKNLKDYLRGKGYEISDNDCLTLYRCSDTTYKLYHNIPDKNKITTLTDKYRNILTTNSPINIFLSSKYSSPLITSLISFDNKIPLSNEKIFKAFEFFCAIYDIRQPFKIK